MAHLQSTNCLIAWRDACNYIVENGDGFNLLVTIDQPLAFRQSEFDEIIDSGVTSLSTVNDVVNTIFPTRLYQRNRTMRIGEFYDLHESIYKRGKTMHRKNRSRWGNYFLRFTKFGVGDVNQLQAIIDAINLRDNDQKACYIMHTSSAEYDNNTRVIGNPCLQYVQFGMYNGQLHLVGVYRNHDFLTKALGNYLGLAKLLEFVCNMTGRNIGTITCYSIHYYLEQKRFVKERLENFTW
jgi:thymidylate synthase